MGRKCCIPCCTIGYASNPKPKHITLFRFPRDESMRQIRIREIKKIRQDWEVGANSRVCSNHFLPENFGKTSVDKKKRIATSKALDKMLNDNAYPCIFPDLPSYLGSPPLKERNPKTSPQRQLYHLFYLRYDKNSVLGTKP